MPFQQSPKEDLVRLFVAESRRKDTGNLPFELVLGRDEARGACPKGAHLHRLEIMRLVTSCLKCMPPGRRAMRPRRNMAVLDLLSCDVVGSPTGSVWMSKPSISVLKVMGSWKPGMSKSLMSEEDSFPRPMNALLAALTCKPKFSRLRSTSLTALASSFRSRLIKTMSSRYIEHCTLCVGDGAANIKMALASRVLRGQPWGQPLTVR
eukprot:359151-Amphidinium_carterae.2